MTIPAAKVKPASAGHILTELSDNQLTTLTEYLAGRLSNGAKARDRRLDRQVKIDKLISTWQKLSPEDSERERIEDNTGKQSALPFNLPVLATHLSDMVSYFAEALAPVSNPFFSANGDQKMQGLLTKFNRDAAARDYFGELNLTLRSLLKYNIGGFKLCWDDGKQYGKQTGQPGNHWKALDMYNTLWDPSIREPKDVAKKGEWAATVEVVNRLEVIRKSLCGEWVLLEGLIESGVSDMSKGQFYRDAAACAQIGAEGQDSRTSAKSQTNGSMNWGAYGLGTATELGAEVDGFEQVDINIWLIPAKFGLLTDAERIELERAPASANAADANDPETFLEQWRFTLVNGALVDAEPVMEREEFLAGEKCELPFYLSFLTQDQLKEAQRSFMELMRGFQRFSSAMYNIYIAGMRKNVWGVTGIDPQMFDSSKLKGGDTVGILDSKQPGRDVRSGIVGLNVNAGVDNALQSVDSTLNLMNQFFPSQALPSQVGGIDRAIKSQVNTVVQGATRALRTLLRILDSGLMLPSRLGAYRNLKRLDKDGIEEVTDEEVAKMLGSGIESMEAERVSEILWQLLYAIIQNQESMQVFDIPSILNYLSRVGNLSVALGDFAKQPPAQQQPPAPGVPGAPPAAAPPPAA
jgi:hypothetical protein